MKHTPTPWNFKSHNRVLMSNTAHIAEVDMLSNADAEFIVRAVNSHEILVKALQEIITHSKEPCFPALTERIPSSLMGGCSLLTARIAKEALEKVK